ncbi:DUF6531 domain-containing protein [Shewanella surugensis]|uniref:DUF6531 domain-containing protein n=1 Tax=Shewanella surugensis TaxID=212020 RepID=A0ABT0LAR5_9GAMM|nr:DUF6531 domain-containing protein [Shewanella surugensis]MCL1124452.1 DUF6531 domain-containing protein [Shewanella surugensis]
MPKAARFGDTAAGHGCMPATPILAGSGDVSINGKPAAREGDMVLLHMCPCPNMPHGIHMRSIKAGSSNVSINGKPAARVDDAIDCGGKVAAGSPDVLIGDTPYQSPAHKCAEGAAKSHAPMLQFEPMLAPLAGTFGAGLDFIEQGTQTDTKKTKDTIAKEKNATEPVVKATQCEGDPIDMATGNVVEWRTDFTLSGLAPLIHKRFYHSDQDKMTGLLGHTWRSYWDMCLEVDNGIVTFIDDKGAKAHYPLPADGEEKRAAHMPAWRLMRQTGQLVMRHLDGTYLGFDSEQPIYPVEDEDDDSDINTLAESGTVETLEKHHLSLSHIRDSYGHELCFIYDNGKLEWVKLSDNKQQVNVESQDGLITKLILCDENQQPLKTLTRFNYNRAGQLISVRSDAGNNFDYEYDKQDNLLKWSDLGETWVEHTYDEFNRALSTRASNGRWQDQIRYDDDNAIVYYKNPHKGIQCYYRDERNNIVKHIDAKGYVTLSQWQNNQLISETNALDERTEYVYDDWGQVSSIIAADGSEHVYEYDDNGQLISVTNPLGARWQYEYDTQQNLIKSSDPLGRRWQFEYDKQGQLTRQTQPDGLQTQFSFNENGQMSQVIPPFGHRLRFQYDVLGRLTERSTHLSDPEPSAALNEAASQQTLVRRWHYEQDKLQPSHVVFEDGSEQRFDYDVEGNLIKVVDPLGQVYGYEYGAFDSLMATTDPLGHTTRYLYNGEGQFAGVINSQNHQWRYHYNELGQITEERHFDGRKTQFEYDPLGRVEKRIAPDGAQLLFYYDVLGRLTQKQALQLQNTHKLASNNKVAASQLALESEYRITSNTFFEYDDASQLIKATVDDSRYKGATASERNAPQIETGPLEAEKSKKVVVEYEYNLGGQRILERINGQTISSEYSASGERVAINSLERPLDNDSPERSLINSPYQMQLTHQQGLLTGVQISDHQALQFKHNSQGFEVSRQNQQGFHLAQAWSLGGDLLTQELATQQLVAGGSEANKFAEQADAYYLGPTKPQGARTLQRHYQYDALARISAIDETHWGSSQFTHNANGQITHQASMPEAATAQSAAPLDSVESSAALRNKEPSAQSIVVKQFDYDAAQNLIEVNQLTPTDKTVQQASNNIIDFASKRLEKQLKYQKGGRVETIGEHTYHYDICGRVFEKVTNKKGFRPQVTQYLWDEEDRLIRATLPGGDSWHYQYDAFGRRVAKAKQQSNQAIKQGSTQEQQAAKERINKPAQIQYLWDGNNLVEQQQYYADGRLADNTQWYYEPDSFRPLAQRQVNVSSIEPAHEDEASRELAPQLHYIIADHAGTPRELCSEDGQVKWRGQQSLWGAFKQFNEQDTPLTRLDSRDEQALFTPESNKQQAANDPVFCDLRYQGQIFDAETGLYYNRHRYYDPDSCQYLTPDPIGMVGGNRPNSYVNNPMEWVDPLGLVKEACKKTNLGRVDGNFSAIEPGPLPDHMAETFSGGKYKVITLEKDTVLHRAGTADQPLGQFFALEAPSGVLQTRVDKAVLPVWPNGAKSPIDTAFEIKIPKGTQVYVGEVGSQGGFFIGGTEQVVVQKPWTIEGVEVLNGKPL